MMKNIPSKCLPREMRSDISIQSKNNIFLIMKIYEPNNSTSKFKGKKNQWEYKEKCITYRVEF